MTWFKNLKVSVKLIAGFALMALLLGGVGWLGISSLGTANENIENIYTIQMLPAQDLAIIQDNMNRQRGNMWRALAENDKKVTQTMLDENEKLVHENAEYADKVERSLRSDKVKAVFKSFKEAEKEYYQMRARRSQSRCWLATSNKLVKRRITWFLTWQRFPSPLMTLSTPSRRWPRINTKRRRKSTPAAE